MSARPVFTGKGLRQLAWSPNGQWLLASWPIADQWIFIHVTGNPMLEAVSRVAEQFRRGASRSLPEIDGWCCTRGAGAW